MCHYITATMPADAREEAVRELAKGHRLKWDRLTNDSVRPLLLPGETYFATTKHLCDCGTSVGTEAPSRLAIPDVDLEPEIVKRRRKGWSAPKIDRWRKEREAAAERVRRKAAHRPDESAGVLHWVQFLGDVFGTRSATSIGVLLHFYHTGVEAERLKGLTRTAVPFGDDAARRLLELEEDVLLVFERPPVP